jgi:hypothetical protein
MDYYPALEAMLGPSCKGDLGPEFLVAVDKTADYSRQKARVDFRLNHRQPTLVALRFLFLAQSRHPTLPSHAS